MKSFITFVSLCLLAACFKDSSTDLPENASDVRFMSSVSDEIVIDTEKTLEENLDKAIEIIRDMCTEGFNSVSCANPATIPAMKFDQNRLLPVTMEANIMAAKEPNYVFIRCESEIVPAPHDLVEECHRRIVQKVRN